MKLHIVLTTEITHEIQNKDFGKMMKSRFEKEFKIKISERMSRFETGFLVIFVFFGSRELVWGS